MVSESVLQGGKDLLSWQSVLCPVAVAALPKVLQCPPFAAQMMKAVGLGWVEGPDSATLATGLLISPEANRAPLGLGLLACGNTWEGFH